MSATQSTGHPHDVCAGCGHLRNQHVKMIDRASCLCYVPWRRSDALRDLSIIDYVTELPLASKAQGSSKDWTSSICPCAGFTDSGLRFEPPDDDAEAQLVRDGRRRRTLIEI